MVYYRQQPQQWRTIDAPRVAIVGGKGAGPCYFSTLNIRCIGEIGIYTLYRQLRENFPMGVGLCSEVRPYKIPLIAYFWGE